MSDKKQSLPLDGCTNLLEGLVGDFLTISNGNMIPPKLTYKITSSTEAYGITRSARKAAFMRLHSETPIRKYAFDTRTIDQDSDRNPRHNLQYYNRSQQYIDEQDQKRLEAFARLIRPLQEIDDKFGTHPEYFDSYARKLKDNINSILKVSSSNFNVFRPQMDYLEQLLYARYRISTEDLEKMSSTMLKERILSKDEDLLKRGSFMHIVNGDETKQQTKIFKDGNETNNDLIKALFGSTRKNDEKTTERTITITIRDSVIE